MINIKHSEQLPTILFIALLKYNSVSILLGSHQHRVTFIPHTHTHTRHTNTHTNTHRHHSVHHLESDGTKPGWTESDKLQTQREFRMRDTHTHTHTHTHTLLNETHTHTHTLLNETTKHTQTHTQERNKNMSRPKEEKFLHILGSLRCFASFNDEFLKILSLNMTWRCSSYVHNEENKQLCPYKQTETYPIKLEKESISPAAGGGG